MRIKARLEQDWLVRLDRARLFSRAVCHVVFDVRRSCKPHPLKAPSITGCGPLL